MKLAKLAVPLAALALVATVRAAEAPVVALRTMEIGQGPTTVVLVHDLGQARLGWMPVVKLLRAQHRLVLVDLPGHGDTPLPDPFSLDAVADAIAAVVAKHPAGSTVLVGHRTGGLLALRAAQRRPDALAGLVVIDAASRAPSDLPDQQKKYMVKAIDENFDGLLKMMYAMAGRDSAQSVALHAQAALVPPLTMKSYMKALLYADASGELAKLTMPVLYVGTEQGWAATSDWPAVVKERGYEGVARMTGRRIAGAGYLVMGDQPDSLAAAIGAFAAGVGAGK